ncbi:MAG TPA: elongation factor G [Acidimicrobiia bacterium]|nr:elongation factor G [Acidimicrobiia bacterium]
MTPEQIRNVALVGHGGSGKTSLAEALLFVAGATTRQGSVDAGTSILDHEPEEIERKISLSLSVASFEWDGHQINLIDTPGYADFSGDARAALRAAGLALFVVSAVDGVEVQTEIMWRVAAEEGIPRAIVVTKLDRDRASFQRTLDQLRESFGKRVAPVQVPIGEEGDLAGIVRVVSERAYLYDEGAKTGKQADLPDSVSTLVHSTHTALIESVVESDDALMEAYFEGTEPSRDVIVETVHKGMLAGEIFPVLVASASTLIGVDTLAEFLVDFGPNPLEHAVPPLQSGTLEVSESGPVAAYVFKTVSDPFVGRISMFRVYSGSIPVDAELELPSGQKVRMHNLFRMQGKDHHDAERVGVGDIAAVAKAERVRAGDTLRSPGSDVEIVPMSQPTPVMELAISPRSNQDDEKLSSALNRVTEEDPTIRMERRAGTGETILAGLGDNHLEVTLARISRKYGVEVDTTLPAIPYRETITATAEVEGKHKKQSGGRGQFGVAIVKFAPRPRGAGFEFIDSVKGGSVPRQLIPAVHKGIEEALQTGILAGAPMVDLSAELLDGKYHSVDSDELSFRMAGIQAVRAAGEMLRPVLLEPIMHLTVRVPEDHTGDIMGDINAKRGRVLGMDTDGGLRVIEAQVPMSEVQRYAVDLRSMTSGRGTFEVRFDHYEEVPHQEAQKIIEAARSED